MSGVSSSRNRCSPATKLSPSSPIRCDSISLQHHSPSAERRGASPSVMPSSVSPSSFIFFSRASRRDVAATETPSILLLGVASASGGGAEVLHIVYSLPCMSQPPALQSSWNAKALQSGLPYRPGPRHRRRPLDTAHRPRPLPRPAPVQRSPRLLAGHPAQAPLRPSQEARAARPHRACRLQPVPPSRRVPADQRGAHARPCPGGDPDLGAGALLLGAGRGPRSYPSEVRR